jgi:hypothetical protein
MFIIISRSTTHCALAVPGLKSWNRIAAPPVVSAVASSVAARMQQS